MRSFLSLSLVPLLLAPSASAAVPVFGGVCSSQGTWLRDALQQNKIIIDAVTALKNDPDCRVLTQALEQVPRVNPSVQPTQAEALANSYRELTALNDFVSPGNFKNITEQMTAHGQDPKAFQDAVYNVAFNESYEKLKDLRSSINLTADPDATRASQSIASPQLSNYLGTAEDIANAAMATGQVVLRAIPQSQTCLHNNPGSGVLILGAIAQTAASLLTGGKVQGLGGFIASIVNFSRDMKYMNTLQGLEYEKFKNSVSCLVESTSESYCALQDAENTLDSLRLNGRDGPHTLSQMLSVSAHDPVASPVAGLVIYMRDIPVVQEWLQRVLYGMSPRQSWQGMAKNDNWSSYLTFIQSVNSLQANFSDKEQLYLQDSRTLDRDAKLGRVREIFNETLNVVRQMNGQASVNFYTRAMQNEMIPFFLLGISMPSDFNTATNGTDTLWLKWARENSNGFDNPDALLSKIKQNLWALMDKAQGQANQLFSQRMVVDPLNLVTAAMRGPGVSPYQAFLDQRTYYQHLILKLQESVVAMQGDDSQVTRRELLATHIPLLKDSVKRLDQVISALQSLNNVSPDAATSTSAQSEQIMDVIYAGANMLVSWDSFFGARMQTALQADLSDTLWRHSSLTDDQRQYFLSVGPDLVTRLAGFYTTDPVAQRSDISSAKEAQIENIKAVEQQFAKVIFKEIMSLDCKLEGGYVCEQAKDHEFDPAGDPGQQNLVNQMSAGLADYRGGGTATINSMLQRMFPQTDDSTALTQVKAKYCMQALAFDSRDLFKEICKGAQLQSDLADAHDTLGLSASFDDRLAEIKKQQQSGIAGHIDRARGAGVCSFRSYLRKNHVYYMYRDYNAGQ